MTPQEWEDAQQRSKDSEDTTDTPTYSQPLLNDLDSGSLVSNPADPLGSLCSDPNVIRAVKEFRKGKHHTRQVHPWIKHFAVSGEEIHGPVATTDIKERAEGVAFFGTLAQVINFLFSWPLIAAFSGTFMGGIVAGLIYLGSNAAQKMAVRNCNDDNSLASVFFKAFIALNLVPTVLAPPGTIVLLFVPDVNNRVAEQITTEFAFSDLHADIAAAKEQKSLAREKETECRKLVNEYKELKEAGNPAYHNSYRQAYGPYTPDVDPEQWTSVPTPSLPACPAANRMSIEADTALTNANDALRQKESEVKQQFGDDYVRYLKVEYPNLYEAHFVKTSGLVEERLRSRSKEISAAIGIMLSGQRGPLVAIVVLTLLSAVTSAASVYSTAAYASDPRVQNSWNAWALFRKEQWMKRLVELVREKEANNDNQ